MLWTQGDLRRKSTIRGCRFQLFKLAGSLKLQQSRERVELVEQAQATVIDYIQLPSSLSYRSIVNQKLQRLLWNKHFFN
jgi:hypothetical protein